MAKTRKKKPARPARSVPCPQCGASFTARGLSTHLRRTHGDALEAAPAALPKKSKRARKSTPPRSEPANGAQERLLELLVRVDERLERMEAYLFAGAMDEPLGTAPRAPDEADALERELSLVLREIEDEKRTASELASDAGEESDEARRETIRKLGRLRRRQFSILFRMGRRAPGLNDGQEDCAVGLF